ncbi:GTP-binding protein [Marimonas sp. MJW-29]|uniref:GTP-binding protein n=1 Tax=Sulfitobacter sediminis TaxID=3234186 RepID=A0ABV3RSN8_9RHOB
MNPLLLTVISGYLGAGKTTLINRLLADPKGLRLMVMVNDFGAINVDRSLIAAEGENVIALTNGCVCCTMGADLFMALGDLLDRRPRPDHLIIEASGIADPKAIANTAIAEPELRYAGIVTLVDALNILDLLGDPLVGPQVRQQIAVADLVLQTKRETRDERLDAAFVSMALRVPEILSADALSVLTLDGDKEKVAGFSAAHPEYVSWHLRPETPVSCDVLKEALGAPPAGLYRLKGVLRTNRGQKAVHLVGKQFSISALEGEVEPVLVGLGPRGRLSEEEVTAWWDAICAASARDVQPVGET